MDFGDDGFEDMEGEEKPKVAKKEKKGDDDFDFGDPMEF